MRYSGRYAILTAFLAGALILKFNNIDQAYEEVEPFRGASIQTEIWNPLIADSVNQKEIGGREVLYQQGYECFYG
mgnify:CR=1 FL=1